MYKQTLPESNTMIIIIIQQVFLTNYTEGNGLLLPGRVPGYSNTAQVSQSVVSGGSTELQWRNVVGEQPPYTTFCRLWLTLLPSIIVIKPLTDLCWTCQQHSQGLQRATVSVLQRSNVLQVQNTIVISYNIQKLLVTE